MRVDLSGDHLHLQRQHSREHRQEPNVSARATPTEIQNQVWNSQVPYSLSWAVSQN